MAFENFKPTIWSKYIQLETSKICVMEEDCNTKFQGEIGVGKQVKIIGAGRPKVGTYIPGSNIAAAETPADTSVYMNIDQFKYTHFLVDDIDEAQAVDGLMQAYMKGSAEELAATRDAYIAQIAALGGTASASTQISDATGAKTLVDDGLVTLRTNGVKISTPVVLTITPWFYNYLKDYIVNYGTDNMELIRKGIIGMYNGATVKISNNLYNDGTDDYMLLRTKDAVAFAAGISKTEAYRPDLQFSDAIKVLDTYGAKVVRQDELYVIKAHKAQE